MKRRLNKKGFTLIELLAVIVVLAIILVITVPMVLNSISSTRQDALNASATSIRKHILSQSQLYAFYPEKADSCLSNFLEKLQEKTKLHCNLGFKLNTSTVRNEALCVESSKAVNIDKQTAKCLGLNSVDYDLDKSYMKLSNDNSDVMVYLVGKGKFENTDPILIGNYTYIPVNKTYDPNNNTYGEITPPSLTQEQIKAKNEINLLAESVFHYLKNQIQLARNGSHDPKLSEKTSCKATNGLNRALIEIPTNQTSTNIVREISQYCMKEYFLEPLGLNPADIKSEACNSSSAYKYCSTGRITIKPNGQLEIQLAGTPNGKYKGQVSDVITDIRS